MCMGPTEQCEVVNFIWIFRANHKSYSLDPGIKLKGIALAMRRSGWEVWEMDRLSVASTER